MSTTGLYRPEYEHDACGVAFVANLSGEQSREIVDLGLTALENLDHRGAVGAEENTGDGAGILLQVPDAFLRSVTSFSLPESGHYAVGIAFLPRVGERGEAVAEIEAIAREEGLDVLGWRTVPIDSSMIGPTALACMPTFRQLFLSDPAGTTGIELDRKAFRVRKRAELAGTYFASLSSRTLLYKGMLTTKQLQPFFLDLSDPLLESALAVVHSRFSTNTFPSWPLAQPFRMVAHNGEINTVRGNRNWMAAREGQLHAEALGSIDELLPVNTAASDSASFDEVLELLYLSGRSLPHAVRMMIPEAWEQNSDMDPKLRAFYQYHANLMEPWDGPASITFTDGVQLGAVLDRNGLRPGRFWVSDSGLVVLASESGVLDIPAEQVVRKGRLQPGKMFLVDMQEHRIIEDDEIKSKLANAAPYGAWISENTVRLSDLPEREHVDHSHTSVTRRQQVFGYTNEVIRMIVKPMAAGGAEAKGSMGSDTPIAVLSDRSRLIFDYFSQQFAQVTNPPLDAIREELVTSLVSAAGREPNLLAQLPEHARKLVVDFPVIDNDELAKIRNIGRYPELGKGLSAVAISGLYRVSGGEASLRVRIDEICAEADAAIEAGASFLILSDRDSSGELGPIPSLLLTSAVHHHLLRRQTRTKCAIFVEAGDVREVHHVALLIGYGATAVNPYLALETAENLARTGEVKVSPEKAAHNLIDALGHGLLKVMSKMGISTVASYRGAQVFQAIGLAQELVDEYFTGTPTPLGGAGLDVIANEVALRHVVAYPSLGITPAHRALETGGEYQWRRDGEEHLFNPETVFLLQHSTRTKSYDEFKRYSGLVDNQAEHLMTLRGLFRLKEGELDPISIDEVEPIGSIMKRFSTGAMSFGSISQEAHETLAVAMNRIGAKSNTGEGGEMPERLYDSVRRSSIKQVASGRFGVTSEYLVNADDIQIKMAQGAKPGEGGQLPAQKVYPWVAEVRHSTPGVELISPPPHHDIYSIEDLAQLIHDLKNANPRARIHVKLVSEVGVGTVAAGVAKAHADVVLISGHDGGTGAAPLTSIKHAGAPWELGLAETQQTLVLNNLRDRIVVQADGQLKTGRDVVVAALLGAEEFGFATAPLVVSGCVMMRVCHKDTCPVGVATQNPELRKRFSGKPEYVVTFFEYIAQEVREILASLGLHSIEEAVGHVELLDTKSAVNHWKASGLDLTPVLAKPEATPGATLYQSVGQDHGLEHALDVTLIEICQEALVSGTPVAVDLPIHNVNRTVGTMLGSELTRRYGGKGLPDGTIDITLRGSAGQSFGAVLPKGITLRLVGDANDYVGKSLSGGRICVRPDQLSSFAPEENVIAGNVIGYGATSGEIFLRGLVGERFGVRNSGATLVSEGAGDHCAEYMTGGVLLVLGQVGRNFGAGMSGGAAYVLDFDSKALNPDAAANGAFIITSPDEQDVAELKELLQKHVDFTGSAVAQAILATEGYSRITKLVPRSYARLTAALANAEADGLDITNNTVWTKIMEASRG
ncbi:glutamate synthase large subunit [Changpingibacter yushuensis]|uniref:glutamate synthase large subunit n=1 Tax=Changpingibacter yushuensis TaxID=2758440 RepID=UPI00293426FA|nr:glutamate synthase large subunit [Changpingibacter yushuensis]